VSPVPSAFRNHRQAADVEDFCMARGRSALIPSMVWLLSVLPCPALAQGQPLMDVFAGYSLLPANGDDFPRQTSHGLQVGVTGHFNRWFGIFGDIGAQFDRSRVPGPGFEGRVADVIVRQLLAGPRFTARFERVDVFGHGLFGVADGDAGPDFSGFSDSGLTFGGGGGIDIRASRRLAVRLQYDLIGSFADIVEGNSRLAAGAVVALGGR
jgi:hypothetical protein